MYTQGAGDGSMLDRVVCALHLRAWRWMWSLPPCGEARKAAWTLGAAALMIERWRAAWQETPTDARQPMFVHPEEGLRVVPDVAIGQRAEALLRIAVWHIDDARGEAHARTRGVEPTIPPHERVYKRAEDGRIYGTAVGGIHARGADIASIVLEDHAGRERSEKRQRVDASAFAELAIASLPDGPWVMTTRDVTRFLELILDDEPVDGRFTIGPPTDGEAIHTKVRWRGEP